MLHRKTKFYEISSISTLCRSRYSSTPNTNFVNHLRLALRGTSGFHEIYWGGNQLVHVTLQRIILQTFLSILPAKQVSRSRSGFDYWTWIVDAIFTPYIKTHLWDSGLVMLTLTHIVTRTDICTRVPRERDTCHVTTTNKQLPYIFLTLQSSIPAPIPLPTKVEITINTR